jgi:hypothetical protein
MEIGTRAYIAGVIDLLGVIRLRVTPQGTQLPSVAINSGNIPMLQYLAKTTGTRAITTRRQYVKAGCSEHCRTKHQHVTSVSGRWSVTGVKATVVLWNIEPFMRLQSDQVRTALLVGLHTGFKPATVAKMTQLGWDVPDFAGPV